MRILHICPDFGLFDVGGGANTMKLLTEAWLNDGNQVIVVTSVTSARSEVETLAHSYMDKMDNKVLIIPIKLLKLSRSRTVYDLYHPINPIQVFRLMRIIRKEAVKADRIIINGTIESVSVFSLAILQKWLGTKAILINHGIPGIGRNQHLLSFITKILHRTLIKIMIYRIKDFIAFSRQSIFELNNLMRVIEEKTHKIQLGIDLKSLDDLQTAFYLNFSIRKQSIDPRIDSEFILAIGRNVPTKGYDLLIKAFAEFIKNHKKVILVIAGQETDYTTYLREIAESYLIESRVIFMKEISDSQKVALMLNTRLLCIPSYREGFGINAMEARLLGIPVIATDTGNHRNTLEGYSNSILIPYADRELLLNAMAIGWELKKKSPEPEVRGVFDISSTARQILASFED